MTSHPIFRAGQRVLCAAVVAVLLSACASVEPGPSVESVDPTTSVAQADQRLAAVAAERAAIEARYAEREAVCYEKFFVNHCLDEAKERRRVALVAQRNVEIEAERFKRRVKVEERDREIAAADAEYKAEEARLAAEPPPPPRETTALPPPRPSPAASRMARRNAKAKEEAARAPQEAAKTAANVRAYEERKRKAEQKQKEVAERVAEREAKAAARKAQEEKAKSAPAGK
ncbi:hypothetical protein [Massilia sp. BSC265]|uniref:hypothetical protein n=1 Tax=Massilia sp. BSC265 TaxID=1549812 RepID=UPI0004E92950|nr:hypothetical protein [Massilia sp. BSC265]KFI06755.1 hypothetical protein JN27_13855 [Massilia sp. BSC265]